MSESETYLIEDWVDYDKSSLYAISTEYYAKRACDSFVNSSEAIVIPNLVTSAYVHAFTLAKFLQLRLGAGIKKLRVLECGSGSGLFARHFLLAAEELGYLDRLEFLVTDISDLFLSQMRERGVFQGFIEGEHYKLVNLNLLNLDSAKTLDGESVSLEGLDLVVCNYVLNALPMLPVRESENGFEKLQVRISGTKQLEGTDLVSDLDYCNSLIIEERWVNYEIGSASAVEQKYFNLFTHHLNTLSSGMAGRFSYKLLELLEVLTSKLNQGGMFYLADIPSWGPSAFKFYSFYTNALANLISESLVISLANSLGMQVLKQKDKNLFRILLYKAPDADSGLSNLFNQDFVLTNKVNLFKKIVDILKLIDEPALLDAYKTLLDKLLALDNKSVTSLMLEGDYYYLMGNSSKALELYKEAKLKDFCNHHPELDRKILG